MIQKQLLYIFTSTETEDNQDNILDSVSTLRYQYFEILLNPESKQLQQKSGICCNLSSRNISSPPDLKALNSVTNSDDLEIASIYIYFNRNRRRSGQYTWFGFTIEILIF
ncbi:Hypothetical_protein [Hexamita inflata]|uniref:Hypothetical_protein n=1 Tax=Hexamita inflata TaxID=28002 RepID=A0AA86NDU3_9EUKA|nr:Hypothetical protein HINF_LOCUS5587 [Hexamita inflata]